MTVIVFRIPLSGESYFCGWESGNRFLEPDDSVFFVHGAEIEKEGAGEAFLVPIQGRDRKPAYCWVSDMDFDFTDP